MEEERKKPELGLPKRKESPMQPRGGQQNAIADMCGALDVETPAASPLDEDPMCGKRGEDT